jgi:hypothetical protein
MCSCILIGYGSDTIIYPVVTLRCKVALRSALRVKMGRERVYWRGQSGSHPRRRFGPGLTERKAVPPLHTKVIVAGAREASHVIDGLYHQSDITIRHHRTDGSGRPRLCAPYVACVQEDHISRIRGQLYRPPKPDPTAIP